MAQETKPARSRGSNWTVLIVLTLFIVVAFFFALEFITASQEGSEGALETLTADSYVEEVNALLAVEGADPVLGEELATSLGCKSCHANPFTQLAPHFTGIATRAEGRRPPLTAAAYLYESILYPGAYLVPGYNNVMPQTYGDLSDQELGAIIAYLLTLTDEEPEATPEATDVP